MIDEILNNISAKQINADMKKMLKERYVYQWDFLVDNHFNIFEIDYQWFYKNTISPNYVYL